MTDSELLELNYLNTSRYMSEKEILYNEFIKMDHYISDCMKKNSIHRHFRTRKAMQECMASDFNPWNTFSYGRKDPTLPNKKAIRQEST